VSPVRPGLHTRVSVRAAFVLCAVGGFAGGVLAQSNSGAASPSPRTEPREFPSDKFDKAFAEYRKGASESARRQLEAIVDGGALDSLDLRRQHMALDALAELAMRDHDSARARAYAVRSTSLRGAIPNDWFMRGNVAVDARDWDDAILVLTTVARQWPSGFAAMDSQYVFFIAREAAVEPKRAAARYALLRALFDAGWQAKYIGPPSGLWFDLARLHLDHGDRSAAAAVLERITDPESIVRMRADRRFDALREANPGRFDVAAAAEAQLRFAREQMARAPDVLRPVTLLASRLMYSGRYAEALELAETAIKRAKSPTAETNPYIDGGEQFPWLLDVKAQALFGLKRFDEAVRQRVEASMLQERGQQNVSQTINLAGLYSRLGRPVDALKTLREVGTPSEFGRMQAEGVRLEAAVQLHDQQAVEEALSYMRAHRLEALSTFQGALLTAGATEEGANLMVERLADEDQRSDALLSLQDFELRAETSASIERDGQWQKLKEIPRVKAAIERVGRVERYSFSN
jgi:tetratricopeptide (TPR) repeat protein